MIGNNLKTARKKSKLTQAQVADRLHISPKTVSSWENNHSSPDPDSLIQLGAVYRCSTDSLLKSSMIDSINNLRCPFSFSVQIARARFAVFVLTLIKACIIVLNSLTFWVPNDINAICNILLLTTVLLALPATLDEVATLNAKWRKAIEAITFFLTCGILPFQLGLMPIEQLVTDPHRLSFFTGFVLAVVAFGCGVFISLTVLITPRLNDASAPS